MSGERKDSSPSSTIPVQRYQCRVRRRDSASMLQTITIEARNLEEAVEKLHHQNYIVTSVESAAGRPKWYQWLGGSRTARKLVSDPGQSKAVKPKGLGGFGALPFVSTHELITFAHQLSSLLKAGVPLMRSLQIVQQGMKNPYFRSVFDGLISQVSQGFGFGRTVGEYPRVFPPVWVHLIEVGEASGSLPAVLEEIAHYQEASERVKGKIISAFFYPCILSTFAAAAVTFLLLNIIPKFEDIFKGFNSKLPALTVVVIEISRFLREQTLIIGGVILALVVGFILAARTKSGRIVLDFVWLKIPIFGALFLQISIVRFTRALATLIRAGVPILQSLEIATKLVGNAVVEEVMTDAREGVRGGLSLGNQLAAGPLLPVFMTQLIAIGEETGQLEHFLDLIANYYEERIDTILGRLTAALEPLLLIVVGCVIGVIVIAMFMPIIEISTAVH